MGHIVFMAKTCQNEPHQNEIQTFNIHHDPNHNSLHKKMISAVTGSLAGRLAFVYMPTEQTIFFFFLCGMHH